MFVAIATQDQLIEYWELFPISWELSIFYDILGTVYETHGQAKKKSRHILSHSNNLLVKVTILDGVIFFTKIL